MKFEIFKFESVTSTNDIAINLIKRKKKEHGCVYANVQTLGRGTHGKKWISEKGNLFASLFFPLKKNYPPFNEFSLINPVIIAETISHFCEKKNISFKWPNDIFLNKKKICGILQEHITLNTINFLVIGIGVNVVSSPNVQEDYDTTNIYSETKKNPEIEEIINLIISSYENFFINLSSYNYLDIKKKIDLISSEYTKK